MYNIDCLLYSAFPLGPRRCQLGRGRGGTSSHAGFRLRQVRSEGQSDGGAGHEGQRRAIAAACKRRGWQLLELVEEAGRSANDRKRPGIEEALRVLESGDERALVAAKLDRLSQALLDLEALLARAAEYRDTRAPKHRARTAPDPASRLPSVGPDIPDTLTLGSRQPASGAGLSAF